MKNINDIEVYAHHVGKEGSKDLEKSIYKKIDIDIVEANISDKIPIKSQIINELREEFPEGRFNAWGGA